MSGELPPPSGPPQPPPDSWAGPAPTGPATPVLPVPPDKVPGSNGLAIAALVLGLAGIFPLAAIAAIVLGIVALVQLQRRIQRGRGMAIAGIVLGVLWLIGWVIVLVAFVNDQPAHDPSAAVTEQSETFVDDLRAGDCFSYTGGKTDEVDLVTVIPCASPHEAQVVITFELPDGAYPGDDKVIDAAEKGCTDKGDPLLTDRAYENLDPAFFYPDSRTWPGDRTVTCVIEAPSGTTTGTALR